MLDIFNFFYMVRSLGATAASAYCPFKMFYVEKRSADNLRTTFGSGVWALSGQTKSVLEHVNSVNRPIP